MKAQQLKAARKARGWTQHETAKRLGVSQPYLALLERGKRKLGPGLAQKAVRVLSLTPTALPLREEWFSKVDPQQFARQLGTLGYPGFAYLRGGHKRNPAELLLAALAQDNLESRLVEALPWLVLHYPEMDREWLVQQAKLQNLANRLGFVVTLAQQVAAEARDKFPSKQFLDQLAQRLRESRLDREDTLCQTSLSQNERSWLLETRPEEAHYWHLLTDLRPEHLPYA